VLQPGTYYKLSEADMRTYFPEGVAGFLKHEFDYAALRDNRAIMHREPARSIIGQLKRFTAGDPSAQRAFLIRGERGTGKSSALNHVVHYARTNGWVVVFMPKVSHTFGVVCETVNTVTVTIAEIVSVVTESCAVCMSVDTTMVVVPVVAV
jgi:predicted AAA+ superfamily ATPase